MFSVSIDLGTALDDTELEEERGLPVWSPQKRPPMSGHPSGRRLGVCSCAGSGVEVPSAGHGGRGRTTPASRCGV